MQGNIRLLVSMMAASAFLTLGSAAFAASGDANTGSPGVTSGPAAHSTTVPNTAVEKQAASNEGQTGNTHELAKAGTAATGVGAPGLPAKQGTESGRAPTGARAQ